MAGFTDQTRLVTQHHQGCTLTKYFSILSVALLACTYIQHLKHQLGESINKYTTKDPFYIENGVQDSS